MPPLLNKGDGHYNERCITWDTLLITLTKLKGLDYDETNCAVWSTAE